MCAAHAVRYELDGESTGVVSAAATDAGGAAVTGKGGKTQRHRGRGIRGGGGGRKGGSGVHGHTAATAASEEDEEHQHQQRVLRELPARVSTLQRGRKMRQKHEVALLEHLLQELVSFVYECKESLDALPFAAATRAGSLYADREDAGTRDRALEAAAAAAAAAYEDEEEEAERRPAIAARAHAHVPAVTGAAKRSDAAAAAADAHEQRSGERGRKHSEGEPRFSSGEFHISDAHDFFSSSPRHETRGARHGEGGGRGGEDVVKVEILARQLHAFVTRCLIPSVEKAKGKAAALKASHANVSEKLQRFEEIVERQTEQLDELQQDLQAKRESDVLRQKNLAGAMESLREENEELRSKVATAERAVLQQQHEKATLEQRLQQVIQQQEKQRQKSDSTNSDSTVSDLSSELASARRELKRLATAATQKDSLIEDLKAALAAKHEEAYSRSAEPFAPLLSGLPVQSGEGRLHRQGSSRSSVDSSDRSGVPHPRSPSSSEVQRKRRTRHRGAVTAAAPLPDGEAAAAGTSADPGAAAAASATAAPVDSRVSTSAPAGEIGAAADSHGQTHAPAGVAAAAAAGDAASLRWAFLAGRLASPRGAALSFLSGNRFTSQRKHFSELMQQQLLLQQQRSGSKDVSPQVPLLRTSVTLARELGSDGFAASSPRSCLSTSRKEHEAEKALSSEGDGLAGEKRSLEGSRGRRAGNLQREQQQWRLLLHRSEQQQRDWQQLQQQREQQQMAIEEARQRVEEALLTTQRGLQHLAEDFSGFRQQQEQQLRDAEERRGRLQQRVQQDQEQWEWQLMHREEERQRQVLQLERQQRRDQTQREELQKAQELRERLHMQMEEQRVRQEEQVLQFTLQGAELQRQQQKIEEVSARKVAMLEETVETLKKTCTEAGRDAEMQQQRFLEISTQMQQLQQKCMEEQEGRGELTRRLDENQRRSEEQQQELERQQQQVVEQQQRLTRQQQLLEQRQMEIEDRNQQQLLQQKKEEYQQVQLQQTLETCENLRMGAELLQQRLDERGRYLEEQQKLFRQQQQEVKQKQRQLLQYTQTQIEQQREQGEKLLEEEVQRRQQLHQEFGKLQEARANLQQELRQRQLELHDQQRQIEKHKQQSEAHLNEQKRQQRQLDRQQQQLEQQQQQLEEQQKRLEQQEQQLTEQRQRLEEQQQKRRTLEKELEEQRQAQRQTKVLEQQLVTVEPEQLAEGTLAAAEAAPVGRGEETRKLQEELQRIRKEMGSDSESLRHRLRQTLATSERDASARAALRATRDAELAAAAKHSAEGYAELQQLHMRHDCLEKAFVASQEEVGNLRRVCSTLKKELLTCKMKREKEFESYKQVIKLRNMERKKQVQQMLEVNESLAMRKEEVETRLTNQLQDFQNDIHALVRLHVQSGMLRRSASQLAADGVQQPPVSSSFATRLWRAYDRKLSESLELTDRSGSIRSTRRSGRPVDMYRPVALSLRSLCPQSCREDGNELDGDGRSSRFSREDSGIGDGRGDNNLAMLDFLPSFMVKLRDKIFNDDAQQLSSYRQRSQRRPADATEDSDAARMTRRWQVRRSLGISTPVATPMSSARSAGTATGRGRYRPGGNGNQVHKLVAEKRPENMEPRETNRSIRQVP